MSLPFICIVIVSLTTEQSTADAFDDLQQCVLDQYAQYTIRDTQGRQYHVNVGSYWTVGARIVHWFDFSLDSPLVKTWPMPAESDRLSALGKIDSRVI